MVMKDRNIESNYNISLDFILALNCFRSDFMAEKSFQVFGVAEHRMQDREMLPTLVVDNAEPKQ